MEAHSVQDLQALADVACFGGLTTSGKGDRGNSRMVGRRGKCGKSAGVREDGKERRRAR